MSFVTASDHRHYGRTAMNDLSSRSHTIFRLVIESKPRSCPGVVSPRKNVASKKVKVSVLNFVDLAGSER